MGICMGKADVGMIRELEGQIHSFTGESITERVMEGSEQINEKTTKRKISHWVKGAME